jgi:hypothetical protein
MLLHFGLGFDEKPLWDFGKKQDFENLVVGPAGLINYFKDLMGLQKPVVEEIERAFNYSELLKKHISKYPSLLASFEVDSISFAIEFLKIRDWLKINGILDREWSDKEPRFQLVKLVEADFQMTGFSDDFEAVRTGFKSNSIPDDFNIVLYNALETLPFHLQELFKALNSSVISKHEASLTSGNDIENLTKIVIGESIEKFNADGLVTICNVNSEEELIPFLVSVSQDKNNLIVAEDLPVSLDALIAANNGAVLGISHEKSADYWKELPQLILSIVDENLDIRKVFQLLDNKYSVFGKAAKPIKKKLERSQAYDVEKWFASWEKWELDDLDEIKSIVNKKFVDREVLFNNDGVVKTSALIGFYEDETKELEKQSFDGFSSQFFKDFKTTISFLIRYLNQQEEIHISKLKSLLRKLKSVKVSKVGECQVNTSDVCPSPASFVSVSENKECCYFILGGTEAMGKGLNTWLFQSELNAIENINPTIIEERNIETWRQDLIRLVSKTNKLVILNVEHVKGEKKELPFLMNLLGQFEIKSIEKSLNDLSEISKSETKTPAVTSVKEKQYWEFDNGLINTGKFRAVESFSSINELIHYPHSYFLGKNLEVSPLGLPDFESVFAAKGVLSHAVIEYLVNNNELSTNADRVKEVTRKLTSIKAAILLIPKFKLEVLEVEAKLVEAVAVFNKVITNLNISDLSIKMEQKVEKENSVFGSGLTGVIDVVLYSSNKPVAVIDIKYTGYSKRKTDLENGSDYQLAIYSRLMDDDKLPKAYFLVKEAKMLSNHPTFFGSEATKITADKTTEEQIIELTQAIKNRKSEIETGEIELGFGTELAELKFWDNLEFTHDPNWKKSTKAANPYERFSNLLG